MSAERVDGVARQRVNVKGSLCVCLSLSLSLSLSFSLFLSLSLSFSLFHSVTPLAPPDPNGGLWGGL